MTHPGGNGQPPTVLPDDGAPPQEEAPAQVAEFASALLEFVRRTVGMTLDYSEETLPVVDHYLDQAKATTLAAEVKDLLAPAAGCYFGEVLRRKYGAHWLIDDAADPLTWRLGLAPCFMVMHPVAMAACALVGGEIEGLDDSFATSDRETPALTDALDAAAPIDEATYYSLAGRSEVISYAADFLMAHALENGTACRYPAAAYKETRN
jgi:hypothetical protein